MARGIEYALGAMLFFGIGDFVYKRGAAAGAQPHHLLMVQSWVFMPTVALYGLLTHSLRFTIGTLWGGLVGLFVLIGFYNFAYSLKSGSISVNAPVFRLNFVITVALAVLLLGESLTAYKIAGVVLALVAVWLLLAAPAADDAAGQRESRSALVRVLVATAAVGIGNAIYKYGLRTGATPAGLIVAQAAVVVTLGTGFVAVVDRGIRPSGAALRYAPVAGVTLAIAFALMVESLARGDASVMVPVAQMGIGVTALAGFLVLREPFTVRKGAGLVAALAALASLAMG
jgi:drug/metabolite transporter (DMT)-like permease